jgi:hypothetical protein
MLAARYPLRVRLPHGKPTSHRPQRQVSGQKEPAPGNRPPRENSSSEVAIDARQEPARSSIAPHQDSNSEESITDEEQIGSPSAAAAHSLSVNAALSHRLSAGVGNP